MSAPTVETVVLSELLSDLPKAAPAVTAKVAGPLLRALGLVEPLPADPDFADTEASGYVETAEAWADRVLGGS